VPKAVLITGAGARVGAHLARGLASDGWHICIHYNRSESKAKGLADAITKAGGSASIVKANLSVPQEVNTLIELSGRRLDALIGRFHVGLLGLPPRREFRCPSKIMF